MELAGQRFGRLVVASYSHSKDAAFWNCLCECGGTAIIRTALLRDGSYKSCGCLSRAAAIKNCHTYREKIRSPYSNPRKLKDLYRNMIDRCYNPSNNRWDCYGGRGIKICDEWLSDRPGFYKWANDNGGCKVGQQIDRINVNGNYEPSNCRFVNALTQANNTRRNLYFVIGEKKRTLTQWCREYNINYGMVKHRINRGWPIVKSLTTPPLKGPNKRG